MSVEVTAFLADSAEAVDGKLYVLGGGWDMVTVRQLPAVQARVALGVLVHIGWNDTDTEHDIRLHLETEDGALVPLARQAPGLEPGSVIGEMGHRFVAQRPPMLRPGDSQTHPITFTVNDLVLEHAGGYSWVVRIDDVVAKRLPMRVVLTQG
ncbi:DUF6941 family protein [Curtobacterium sp. RRHDQ10]|uniref:DUF6941 family protein n=1 Tax=Curtobacterium phyllosphaerae TaxID=3413379 RepID=UPI003BF348A0